MQIRKENLGLIDRSLCFIREARDSHLEGGINDYTARFFNPLIKYLEKTEKAITLYLSNTSGEVTSLFVNT